MWSSLRCRLEHPILHHPGLEKSFHQRQYVSISDLRDESCHDDFVWNVVKEPFQVGVQHMPETFLVEFQDAFHGHVAPSPWAKSVRIIVKQRFEDGTQEPSQHFLSHSILDCRDT